MKRTFIISFPEPVTIKKIIEEFLAGVYIGVSRSNSSDIFSVISQKDGNIMFYTDAKNVLKHVLKKLDNYNIPYSELD